MRIGISVFATDRSWPVDDLARAAEDRGLASLMAPEHTHMPVDHTPHPAGFDLPEEYQRTLDPFLAPGAAAGVDRASMWVPSTGRTEALPALDALAAVVEELA